MKYLLTLMSDNGDTADVDIDLENLDLSSELGRNALAEAVAIALAEIQADHDE